MLITAALTSTLTSRVKREAKVAQMRERRIQLLYENNKRLILARNHLQIIECGEEGLVKTLNRNIAISILDEKQQLSPCSIYSFEENEYHPLFHTTNCQYKCDTSSSKSSNEVFQFKHFVGR